MMIIKKYYTQSMKQQLFYKQYLTISKLNTTQYTKSFYGRSLASRSHQELKWKHATQISYISYHIQDFKFGLQQSIQLHALDNMISKRFSSISFCKVTFLMFFKYILTVI
ncbi:Hypothetical_protein [Hexamita inflata]|uniref:Hypothetical_protein n=1 Tax=Hexamita inflata TaxID=28002 RepID=A0AA86UL37_9EUKA|nr:Hypothetical protein HINF_LOCUS50055 [Hexamita inflata]CAI9962413.1 Hypothetical protein HINF_LOCUS50058 [Hexamita inflata]